MTIGNSVTSIGKRAFYKCSGLTSIVVESGNPIYDSRDGCNAIIETSSNILLVGCKNTIIPNSVTSIGYEAFYLCSGLTSVTIPNSVTSIGGCAFVGCSGLTSMTIPNSVTSIGNSAFSGCSGLTSVTIPNSVTSIGGWAFIGCSSLTSIVVESGNPIYDSRDGCNAIIETSSNTLLVGCKNTIIPNSVTSIGERAFYGCSGLTSVTIPNSVTSIGYDAFDGCSSLTSVTFLCPSVGSWFIDNTNVKEVVFGNSVTSIGEGVFYECSGLTSVTIGNSVTSIGGWAFIGCSSLTSIVVESGNPIYDSRDGCNAIIETSSNTLLVGCKNTIIPNSVTSIGKGAFYKCSGLTSVTIPNSVTSIGECAFYECSGLTSIVVESGNPIYDSRDGCNAIIETSSNTLCFGCKNTIIPNSVTSIWGYAFGGCSGLTSVTIPNSVTSIGELAFIRCSGLTSMTIPNSVTSIGLSAFYGCSGLTSVTIGNSVTSIGSQAFHWCYGLTSVTSLNTTPPQTGDYPFTNYDGTLYVPKGCKTTYLSREIWQNFKDIVEIDVSNSQYTLTYMVDGEVYKTYMLKEGDMITPEPEPTKEGYSFSGWSEIPSVMPNHDVTVSGTFISSLQCATPTVTFVDGKMHFECETEDVEFHYSVTTPTYADNTGNDIPLSATYTIQVYATKDGYKDSDMVMKDINVAGLKGDVNNDGEITAQDASLILQYIAGKTSWK